MLADNPENKIFSGGKANDHKKFGHPIKQPASVFNEFSRIRVATVLENPATDRGESKSTDGGHA
jgi:hypothetical protein